MTQNRRIVLNIVATYGRSLYALILGLFTARWALQALGQVDFGLYGLIGGLAGFVSFFNVLLASAVGRFYAVSIGSANRAGNQVAGLEVCREWFNLALMIHTLVPIFLLIVGYPVGEWAVRNFLTIPLNRVDICAWVWRCTCLSCLVGMVSVPFNAMYTAKQEIAELTIYSFFTTTFNALFLYYMVTHPDVWLFKYAAWSCFLVVLPQSVIVARALIRFPECKVIPRFFWNRKKFVELLKFAFARFVSALAGMLGSQVPAILVNKYAGPRYNAAMTTGNSLAMHAMTLSNSLSGAFWPAIANKAGEGDECVVKRLCFMTCRLGTVLILIFALPLTLEIDEVLRLWLVNPPDFAAPICVAMMTRELIDKTTDGYSMAILGVGRGVMQYSWSVCWAGFAMVGVMWVLFIMNLGMWSVVIGCVVYGVFIAVARIVVGAFIMHYSIRDWFISVLLPVFAVSAGTLLVGSAMRFIMPPSIMRVAFTTFLCEMVFVPCVWRFILSRQERTIVWERVSARFHLISSKSRKGRG